MILIEKFYILVEYFYSAGPCQIYIIIMLHDFILMNVFFSCVEVLIDFTFIYRSNGCEVRKHNSQCDNMMEIGSRRIFNSDHDIFRTSCRKFFTDEVLPHHTR